MDITKEKFEFTKIKKNKSKFEKLLKLLAKNKNLDEKLVLAKKALTFATYSNCGYFESNVLENFYCDLAKTIDNKAKINDFEKNNVLHVMTTSYVTGGHTRVVEKWINLAPDYQNHSVVLLDQSCEIPQKLKDNIKNKNGELYIFNKDDDIFQKAIKLRELASKFEYVVLHIHMDDPTALVAFGSEEFSRPILFFNHADHLFWVGKSISDIILDFRTIKSITKTRRNIKNPYFLGIPPETEEKFIKPYDKNEARKKLNLPLDKKIILTAGAVNKYMSFKNKTFIDFATKILEKEKDAILYAIGPSLNNEMWKIANEKTNGRIVPLGTINYGEEYFNYLKTSDLILDSWPMSGGTVIMDAISMAKPILSLDSEIGQLDYILKSKSFAKNEDELTQKAILILNDSNIANEYISDLKNNYINENDPKLWQERLKKLEEIMPRKHSIKRNKEPEMVMINDYIISLHMFNININKNKEGATKSYFYRYKYLLYKYIIKNLDKQKKYFIKYIDQYLAS